jgi:NAD(P)-dependent dehydrogenase (short-subunit alcohol dehydrogenase family)
MKGKSGGLSGKLCVVTGATSGIGLATARALARLGGRVVAVGRDQGRARAALRALSAETQEGESAPRYELADLSLMREVSALASRLSAAYEHIDVLVNCAGAYTARRVLTPEGLETQFAVNYLAPFLLTTSLLPRLTAAPAARIITVSSNSHYYGRICWRDPSLGRFYLGLWAYEQSKLAEVLFSYELVRRLGPDSPVAVYVADPGLVNTDMGQKQGFNASSLFWSLRRRAGASPEVPAGDIAFLASSEEVAGLTGLYWRDRRPKPSSRRSYDEAAARRLWALSERMLSVLGSRWPTPERP